MSTDSPATTPLAAGEASARVLVVDDNPDIVTLSRRILQRHSYEVLEAADGCEALRQVEERDPDLVLLDVMLPGLDGLEVCRRIKSNPETRQIMVLLITGCGSLDHRVEGLEAGADDYITKPFHITELIARVRSALRIKRLTDEIEERNRQLLLAQEERLRAEKMATIGLLATGIAHEFNNIMSGISGFAQLAKQNPRYKDQLVEVTMTQAERAMKIANSLSTFYRPSTNKQLTDVRRVVENARCLVVKKIKEKGLRIVDELGDAGPVLSHAGQIQEVVLNLLLNAIDACEEGGTITLRLEREGPEIRLSVRDTGCGIPSHVVDRIFDPFFTTKGPLGGGKASGSGLGLSVSYNIVRSHGGQLSVTSQEGQGSTFTIRLPAATGPTPDQPVPAATESAERQEPAAAPRVVVADPEDSFQEVAVNVLRDLGSVSCESWEELERSVEAGGIETILLDTGLPGARSFADHFAGLLASHPELRVFLTSKHLSDETLRQCVGQASGHLLKPYTVENLLDLMTLQPAEPVGSL